MPYRFWLSIIFFLFVSCSSEPEAGKSEYSTFIANVESVAIAESIRIPYEDSPADYPLNLTSDGQHVVVVNAKTWDLHLMNSDGTFLDTAGGLGRGPGEFLLINDVHIGADNRLYVYDGKSQKVTAYSITNEELQLEEEMTLPANDTGLLMKSIYKAPSGYVGVFKQLLGRSDRILQPLYVYKLTDDLELQERLVEMPGDETFQSDRFPVRMQNPLGDETGWGMASGHFFYSVNNNLSVTSVAMPNGPTTTYDFSDLPKPLKGEEEIEALNKKFELGIKTEPKYKELIREGRFLRYYTHFLPTENYFYYKLNTPGAENGTLLRIDRETREFKKITVPAGFKIYAANGDMIFGIDRTASGASEIVFLQLES